MRGADTVHGICRPCAPRLRTALVASDGVFNVALLAQVLGRDRRPSCALEPQAQSDPTWQLVNDAQLWCAWIPYWDHVVCYAEALEVALCYGWIDRQKKGDSQHH